MEIALGVGRQTNSDGKGVTQSSSENIALPGGRTNFQPVYTNTWHIFRGGAR